MIQTLGHFKTNTVYLAAVLPSETKFHIHVSAMAVNTCKLWKLFHYGVKILIKKIISIISTQYTIIKLPAMRHFNDMLHGYDMTEYLTGERKFKQKWVLLCKDQKQTNISFLLVTYLHYESLEISKKISSVSWVGLLNKQYPLLYSRKSVQ